jgi:TonB-linked SusC/RagA family outer membrane protein
MKKLFLLLIFFPMLIYSQTKTVTGTVKDSEGVPLPGVSIQLKTSKNTGVSTDFDGNFTIDIQSGVKPVLVFSYIGFLSQEMDASDKNTLSITLQTDTTALDEVVVVGYGTQRKSDLTGAIASVKVEEIVARQSSTVDGLLTGRVAGVQVIQNGTPGGGISVRIRGASSLRGNNEPLYVVDGIIISSAGEDVAFAESDGQSTQESQNGLNGINPRDIESMEVLKDASATAIYGSRGANGVILITTKKGKEGKVRINAFTTTTLSQMGNTYDVLDSFGYAKFQNEVTDTEKYSIVGREIYRNSDETGESKLVQQVNWQEEGFRTGISVEAGASISGGSEKGNFYVSGGFRSLEGIAENSGITSGDLRVNINHELTDKLSLALSLTGFISDGQFSQDGSRSPGPSSYVASLLKYKPMIESGFDDDDNDLEQSNPYSWINDFDDLSKEKRFIGNISLTYKLPIEGLKYVLQFGGNTRYKERRRFYGITTFPGQNANGKLAVSSLNSTSYQLNNLLQYNKNINKNNRINAVLGITYDAKESNNEIFEVSDFTTLKFRGAQPRYAQIVSRPIENIILETQLLSFLGRVNYTLKNRYIFTGSFRVDGSSKFSDENKFGFFPSASAAWRVTEEGFMNSIKNTLNEFKLRVGWGRIGNQAINPYQTNANFGPVSYGNASDGINVGFAPLNIANPDLKWETTEQINAGVDFGLFHNRITGSVDVYSKETKDLLQEKTLGPSAGYPFILVNRGGLSNKGIELQLGGAIVNKDDFRIDLQGNIAFNKSKINDLGIPSSYVVVNGERQERSFYLGEVVSTGSYFKAPANIFMEGEEIGLFYGWETDGIYQEGDVIDVDGAQVGDVRRIDQLTEDTDGDGIADAADGVIDIADRTLIGNPNPDFIYGLNLTTSYKRFNLHVLANGVSGVDIANGNLYSISDTRGGSNNVLSSVYENAWSVDNPSTTQPRIGYSGDLLAQSIDDRIIEDGSYFRLSNVTLGYDVPVDGLDLLNIYMSGTNLFTITDYSGFNPDVTSFANNGNIIGVDWNGAPNVKTFLIGLNIKF